jgi:hypothetical protein
MLKAINKKMEKNKTEVQGLFGGSIKPNGKWQMPNSHSRRMAAIYVGSFSFKSGRQKKKLLFNLYGHSPFIIGH